MTNEEKLEAFRNEVFLLIGKHFGPDDGLIFTKRVTLAMQMMSLVKYAIDYAYKWSEPLTEEDK